jgi:hypothetical protein
MQSTCCTGRTPASRGRACTAGRSHENRRRFPASANQSVPLPTAEWFEPEAGGGITGAATRGRPCCTSSSKGSARELIGPGALLGNHVVLDLGDGIYAVLAHLKRGSIGVQKGQVVRVGQKLAECGNSGNSSEPHIHFQLMDTPRAAFAAGLPFRFSGHDMPKNGQPLVSA